MGEVVGYKEMQEDPSVWRGLVGSFGHPRVGFWLLKPPWDFPALRISEPSAEKSCPKRSWFALCFFSQQLKIVVKRSGLGWGHHPNTPLLLRGRWLVRGWRHPWLELPPLRSVPSPSQRLACEGWSRIRPRRLGRCRGARAQLFPASAFVLGVCCVSKAVSWGGITRIFIVTLYITWRRLSRQLPPLLPHPGGATKSRCRRGGEHQGSVRSSFCPAKHLRLHGGVFGGFPSITS